MDPKLGVAVIGLGNAGARHARALAEGKIPGARLAAVCDPSPAARSGFGVPSCSQAKDALSHPEVAAVVIAAPHRAHVELCELSLRAGRHVLVEKPLAVHKAEASRVLEVHASLGPERPLFAVVQDYRVDPGLLWIYHALKRAEFGRVERVLWQATAWYRTEAYYHSSSWRGSFAGEGGGALLNQGPHLLDTLVWLFGLPRRVSGFCRFGHFHPIEVEDDVTAVLEFPSGLNAVVIVATGEAPGLNRLEVCCDKGRITLEDGRLLLQRNREPASVHRRREQGGRPLTDLETREVSSPIPSGHRVLANFVDAIQGKAKVLAPAVEAAAAVEIANAILWSTLQGSPVNLPLDGAAFESVLAGLCAAGEPRFLAGRRSG